MQLPSESSRKLLLSLGEADTNYTNTGIVGDAMQMKKVIESLEEHVYSTMNQNFFDYRTIRFEVSKCAKLFKRSELEWEKHSYWKRLLSDKDCTRTEILNRINTSVLNEIDRVSTFYGFEEVKLLSLSYDTIARLRDTVIDDFELVTDLLDSMECTLAELFEIVVYLNKTVRDIETSLKEYMDKMSCKGDPVFRQFIKSKLSQPGSTFRILIEHSGVYKAFYMAKFSQNVIEKEMSNTFQKFNLNKQECDLGAEADEKSTLTLDSIKSLIEINKLLDTTRCLLSAIESILPSIHSSCLWHQLGIHFTEYQDAVEMAQHTINYYTDVSLTKDDYINAKLKEFEVVDNYEEESDRPSSDVLSLWIVILHTTFYITNYYGLYPVSYEQLHNFESITDSSAAFCIAVTPLVSTLLVFYYDWVYPRIGFKQVYLQSYLCLILGNLLYSLASMPKFSNLAMLIIGRGLIGAGGVRIITKKYLAIFINDRFRAQYSNMAYVLGHVGKAVGPGISALLLLATPGKGSRSLDVGDKYIHGGNIFTIFCAGVWFVGFLAFLRWFRRQNKLLAKKIAKMKKQAKIEAMRYQSVIENMGGKEIKKIVIESRKRNAERKESLTPLHMPRTPISNFEDPKDMFIELHKGSLGIVFKTEMEEFVAASPVNQRGRPF